MKALAGILAVAAVVFAFLYVQELRANQDLSTRSARLSVQLADQTSKQNEAAKASCSTKSAQVFQSLGYSDHDDGKSGRLPSYTNHYNPKLKRCLMMLEIDQTTTGAVSKQVFDVDEREPLGDYYWIPSKTKKYWEQAPIQCHMTPPGRDEAFCRSTVEWDAYVKSLMS